MVGIGDPMKVSPQLRKSIRMLLVCLSITPVWGSLAQQSTPPVESPVAAPAPADRHISLDVVVADKAGAPVSGLQQQDFKLLDQKSPQKILSFRAVDQSTNEPPAEVILLIDAVNANFTTVSYERNQIERFLGQNDGKLAQPVSIMFFEDTKTEVQRQPSRDGKALLASFDQNVTGLRNISRSTGFYGAEERLELSLKTLSELAAYEATKPGRKLLVWISPGWPLLSGPRVDMSNAQQRAIFNSVVTMSADLRRARITLYSVDPLGTNDAGSIRLTYYEEFLKGVTSPNRVEAGNLALQVLAIQSGGRVLNASNDITDEINRCVRDAGPHYELTFEPAPAEHPDEYHGLQVNVDKPGLTVRTRTGYYAQP